MHIKAQVGTIAAQPAMLTRRGAFRQRGMDLPKIQTGKPVTSAFCG